MKKPMEDEGEVFQASTKYVRGEMPHGGIDLEHRPAHFKKYPDAIKDIHLPEPDREGGGGLFELLAKRRTRRTYKPEALSLAEVSQLLWAANGKTKEGRETCLKTAPSAGALYPIELYLMANNVTGLDHGIYHFSVAESKLSLIREGDYSEEAARSCLSQPMLSKSGAVVFMTAVIERCRWKYHQRAYRYIYLDAGHIAQNLGLAAESMGLGSCPIGAFYDDEINAILGVDGVDETLLYGVTVGR